MQIKGSSGVRPGGGGLGKFSLTRVTNTTVNYINITTIIIRTSKFVYKIDTYSTKGWGLACRKVDGFKIDQIEI